METADEVKNGGEHSWAPPRALVDHISLWFEESVVVPDEFRNLLVQYSHIQPEEVDEHVLCVVSTYICGSCDNVDTYILKIRVTDLGLISSATAPGKFIRTHAWANSASWN